MAVVLSAPGKTTNKLVAVIEGALRNGEAELQIKEMAAKYGCDISRPAETAQEAIQWTYFGYLAAVKSQNGARDALNSGDASTDASKAALKKAAAQFEQATGSGAAM